MAAQFSVGRRQFGLFQFQQPFGSKTRAPFLGKFIC